MTAKRDLKRRVRQRQARTGESYVTARRRLLAAQAELGGRGEVGAREEELERVADTVRDDDTQGGEDTEGSEDTEGGADTGRGEDTEGGAETGRGARAAETTGRTEIADAAMAVVELQDLTAEAKRLGFCCRIMAFPSVLEAGEVASVLVGLRNALVGAKGGTGTARMFDVAFGLPSKPLVPLVVRAYPLDGTLSFSAIGRSGPVEIACRLWYPASTLVLRRAGENERDTLARPIGAFPARFEQEAHALAEQLEGAMLGRLKPRLWVIYRERRHPVTRSTFTIGRDRKFADLAIRDGWVSRKHAAVIFRNGAYYLKDLGSTNGIHYKGMRIDRKRIDEGDVIQIREHELRFTYEGED
jgi:hypothetical protein